MSPINLNDSTRLVDPGRLLKLQIVCAALVGGLVICAGAVIFIYSRHGAEHAVITDEKISLISLLSLVHAILAILCYAAGILLFRRKVETAPDRQSGSGHPLSAFAIISTAVIVRLAVLEGAAQLGLVVCLIASMAGVLRYAPIFWLNLLSTVLFLIFASLTFPTRPRVEYLVGRAMTGS